MTSIGRTRYSGLLILAAGIGLAAAPLRAQTAPPPPYSPWASIVPPAQATPDDAADDSADAKDASATDNDIKGLELDWSQLNVDASTFSTGPASKTRLAPQTGSGTDMTWSSSDRPNGAAAVSVKQSLFNFHRHPGWRRHDGDAAAADADGIAIARQWRQPAAILRRGLGRDHRPGDRLGLGQDRGRSPARSVAGAKAGSARP